MPVVLCYMIVVIVRPNILLSISVISWQFKFLFHSTRQCISVATHFQSAWLLYNAIPVAGQSAGWNSELFADAKYGFSSVYTTAGLSFVGSDHGD